MMLKWESLSFSGLAGNSKSKGIFESLTDYVSLLNASGNGCQGEDLHVLSRGALTGDVLGFLFQLSDNYVVPPSVCGCDIYLVHINRP